MAEYTRRSGSKMPVRSHRSKRGMRERRDLRNLDKEEDADKLFKAPSRRRVYELRAMADSAGADEGMIACRNHGYPNCCHGYIDCWCGYNTMTNTKCCEQVDEFKSLDQHEYVCPDRHHMSDLHEEGDCVCYSDKEKCLEHTQNEKLVMNTVISDKEMHETGRFTSHSETMHNSDKMSEVLDSIKLTYDIDPLDVTVKEINSDIVKSLSIEVPCKNVINNEKVISEEGYSEDASTSYILYFSEGDWCRPLESPPEDEDHLDTPSSSAQMEEEQKHKKGGVRGGSKSRSYSSSRHMNGSSYSYAGSSDSSGSSYSTSISTTHKSQGRELPLAPSPNNRRRHLSDIPEHRSNGDTEHPETRNAAEKQPKSSGNGSHIQGNMVMAAVQGGRDENQNRTSWKSVVQTNLGEKIDNAGSKDVGSSSRDSQKMGFHIMQVIIIEKSIDESTCSEQNTVITKRYQYIL